MTAGRGLRPLAIGLVAATVLLAVVAALREPLPLPVLAHLGVPVRLAVVQGTAAVLVPPALVAVVAVLRATGRLERSAVLWAEGAAAPIVVFLVARLNGVEDAVALVLVYAAVGGDVLLRVSQRRATGPLPIRLASVLGIVPWGVIAFTQIGAGLVGTPPSVAVRVLTIVVLLASVLEYVVAYRRRAGSDRPVSGLLLAALPGLLLAALVLLTV